MLQCSKLHCLVVSDFRWVEFPSFSAGPGWQRLRELSLAPVDEPLSVASAEAMAEGFSCLRSLLVLTLSGENINPLLAHVHRIPSLRRLIIGCFCFAYGLPHSNAAMLSLLRSCPDLGVEWQVDPSVYWRIGSMLQPLAEEACFRLLCREGAPLPGGRSLVRLVRDA